MITLILLVIIAAIAWSLLSNSSKQTKIAERMERQQHDTQHGDVPAEIAQMLRAGDRIGAVRAYRQLTGCSLEIAMAKLGEENQPVKL